ncbi:MAG TPA: DUF3307 domain-containing protein [Planctomycetota bacterium]|jgi:hypothetical protein|nr:DUF3307 domain-containing protein [Planctomycetota bacterium]
MTPDGALLLRLLIAHVVGDFFLQPKSWILDRREKKARSAKLYIHGFVHLALIALAVGDFRWGSVALMLVVASTHMAIDLLKSYGDPSGRSTGWFILDQALHVLVLLLAWYLITGRSALVDLRWLWSDQTRLAHVLAVLILTRPTGFLINMFTEGWRREVRHRDRSLSDAGMWIGLIERPLVLLFVLQGVYEAVGFLLAAKSVFRFGELKDGTDRKRTEYVLIGTLLSFGIAIFVGILARMVT